VLAVEHLEYIRIVSDPRHFIAPHIFTWYQPADALHRTPTPTDVREAVPRRPDAGVDTAASTSARSRAMRVIATCFVAPLETYLTRSTRGLRGTCDAKIDRRELRTGLPAGRGGRSGRASCPA
jgi:hypothetical protein